MIVNGMGMKLLVLGIGMELLVLVMEMKLLVVVMGMKLLVLVMGPRLTSAVVTICTIITMTEQQLKTHIKLGISCITSGEFFLSFVSMIAFEIISIFRCSDRTNSMTP